MEINSKIIITIVIVLSYSFLKFSFPLMIDILKSVNPNLEKYYPTNIVKRIPDILGLFLLIVIILVWSNNMN